MNNLILAVIAIAFTALIMTAGISYLTPMHAMLNTEATATEAQVQEMLVDYHNLAMNLGRPPSVNDYVNIYGNGSLVQTPNLSYQVVSTGPGTTTIEHDVNIGPAANNIKLQMQFVSDCGGMGSCFEYTMDASQMSAPNLNTTCQILTMVENRMRTDNTHSYFTPPANLHCI